jgi:hypothetical protein
MKEKEKENIFHLLAENFVNLIKENANSIAAYQ